jgi:hypothetical protein
MSKTFTLAPDCRGINRCNRTEVIIGETETIPAAWQLQSGEIYALCDAAKVQLKSLSAKPTG